MVSVSFQMESSRDSPFPSLVNNDNEVEIVGQRINKKHAERSTVAKASLRDLFARILKRKYYIDAILCCISGHWRVSQSEDG